MCTLIHRSLLLSAPFGASRGARGVPGARTSSRTRVTNKRSMLHQPRDGDGQRSARLYGGRDTPTRQHDAARRQGAQNTTRHTQRRADLDDSSSQQDYGKRYGGRYGSLLP
eukprot:4845324-Prymnesium_polylepis.1